MDDAFAIMLDVAGLVTRGSDAARTEARRIATERARRIAADQPDVTVVQAARWMPAVPWRWLKIAFLSH
jgi:hypothetical protein